MEDLSEPLLSINQNNREVKNDEKEQEVFTTQNSKHKGKSRKEFTPLQALLMSKMTETINNILEKAERTLATPYSISCLALSTDGCTVFYGSSNGHVSKYHTIEEKITDDVPLGDEKLNFICLDELNNRAVVCGETSKIMVYKLPRFEVDFELEGHESQVNQIIYDINHEFLYSASDDFSVRK